MSFSIKTSLVVCLGFLPFAVQSAQAQNETMIKIKRLGNATKAGYQAKLDQATNPKDYFQLRREGLSYIYVTALDDTLAATYKADMDSLGVKIDDPLYWNATEVRDSSDVLLIYKGMYHSTNPWKKMKDKNAEKVHVEEYDAAKHGIIEFYPDTKKEKTRIPRANGEFVAFHPVRRPAFF